MPHCFTLWSGVTTPCHFFSFLFFFSLSLLLGLVQPHLVTTAAQLSRSLCNNQIIASEASRLAASIEVNMKSICRPAGLTAGFRSHCRRDKIKRGHCWQLSLSLSGLWTKPSKQGQTKKVELWKRRRSNPTCVEEYNLGVYSRWSPSCHQECALPSDRALATAFPLELHYQWSSQRLHAQCSSEPTYRFRHHMHTMGPLHYDRVDDNLELQFFSWL